MKSEKLAKQPTESLQEIIEEVQRAANETQSEAFRYERAHDHDGRGNDDGSVIEIRCAPEPRVRLDTNEDLPAATDADDGTLAVKGGKLYRAVPKVLEQGDDPVLLGEKVDAAGTRMLYQLAPPPSEPPLADDGTIDNDRLGERPQQEYALVEFAWEEVDDAWTEHAVKKAADVRLTALPSARVRR